MFRYFLSAFTNAIVHVVRIPDQRLAFLEFRDCERAASFHAWVTDRVYLGSTLQVSYHGWVSFLKRCVFLNSSGHFLIRYR